MKNPSALKSAPFWILLVASAGVGAYGVQAAVSRIATMEAGLTDGTATTAQVYGGQSWVVLESVLAGAGIIGVLIAVAVWALGPRLVAAVPAASTPVVASSTPLVEPAWGEQTANADTHVTEPETTDEAPRAESDEVPTTTANEASLTR